MCTSGSGGGPGPSVPGCNLRQCTNGRERSRGPGATRVTSRSRGLLLRWALHGLHCRVPVEARHMLRIGLPPLPLSRHGSRSESSCLILSLRFHPGQSRPRRNHRRRVLRVAHRDRLLLVPRRSRALPLIAPLHPGFQPRPCGLPSAHSPAAPG